MSWTIDKVAAREFGLRAPGVTLSNLECRHWCDTGGQLARIGAMRGTIDKAPPSNCEHNLCHNGWNVSAVEPFAALGHVGHNKGR